MAREKLESDDDSDLKDLHIRPAPVRLISLLDGFVYEFLDDGVDLTSDGNFPHGSRQKLLAALAKIPPRKRRPGVDNYVGDRCFVFFDGAPKKRWDLDPLPFAAPAYDKAKHDPIIEENRKRRKEIVSNGQPEIDAMRRELDIAAKARAQGIDLAIVAEKAPKKPPHPNSPEAQAAKAAKAEG